MIIIIAIDFPGVCQFVCYASSWGLAVQTRLNGSRSCLG